VAEQGPRPEEPGPRVDVGVALGAREGTAHRGDLGPVLGHVSLHEGPAPRGLGPRRPHQPLGAGQREARRVGVAQAPLGRPVPAVAELAGLAQRGVRAALARVGPREGVVVGAAVHHHLAHHQAQARALPLLEGGLGAVCEHAQIHRGGRGAVGRQLREEEAAQAPRVLASEAPLEREDVLLEPGQELPAVGGDRRVLRQVAVRVHEPRDGQTPTPVEGPARRGPPAHRADLGQAAPVHGQQGVRPKDGAPPAVQGQRGAAEREGHRAEFRTIGGRRRGRSGPGTPPRRRR
jgi:hypothetical protein